MSNKAKLKRIDHRSMILIAVFGVLTVISGLVFMISMSRNSQGAVDRFETLKAVDQAGGDVDAALNDLRTYIYSHMNTEIGGPNGIYPPIQLSGTYERLVAAEEKRIEEAKSANETLYSDAQAFCERTGSQGFSGSNRINCINKYVDENGVEANTEFQPINESFYKYDFVSPRWSPDVAGFSLLFTLFFAFITVVNLAIYLRTRHLIKMGN